MKAAQEVGEGSREPPAKRSVSIELVFTVAALALSIFSFYRSESAQRDVARIESIKTEYDLFHNLSVLQLEHPLMAHLFAVTNEAYDENVSRIKSASATISREERATLQLQERALAHHMFTTYEETYYLWVQAANGDSRRAALEQSNLTYFNDALCRNPRLLWYWDSDHGGKLDLAFAPELRVYYRTNVQKECSTEKDAAGPFASDEVKK